MPTQSPYSQRYKAYVLLILTGVYTFNFIDRQILVIIQESIKKELLLSDTQLGMLTGLTFALFYATLGIPIARFADKNNRKNIVSVALMIWSGMTALSGLVNNYWQLLLARIGVGVGEAGGSPPAHSIISDYFPPQQRATALSIYSVGIYIGILAGYSIGGWIDQTYGWRAAFYALGIPGVIYAFLLFFTVKEPKKGLLDAVSGRPKEKEFFEDSSNDFGTVVRYLFSKKTFVFLAFGCGIHTFTNYGVGNWAAPFLERVHELPKAQVGVILGLTSGFGGIIGTFSGGYLADKFGQKDIRWYLWIPVIVGLISVVPSLVVFYSDNTNLVIGCYFLNSLLTALYLGPSIAVTHNLVDAKMRALASAILFLILNLIGLGLGPITIGYISDLLTPAYGNESLRYAFTITFVTGAISIILFYLASKHYPKEAIIEQKVTKKSQASLADMKPVLNIILGVFLLFIVGLFFLQIGLAGKTAMSMPTWVLGIVGLFFAGGVFYTAKGVVNGD